MKLSRLRSTSLVLVLAGVSLPSVGQAEVLFEENFDRQEDWHSGLEVNATSRSPAGLPDRVQAERLGHTVPRGWDSAYQDPSWAPSVGFPDGHETIEILGINTDKARGGAGKSFVQRRDSRPDPGHYWSSDGQLLKYFPAGHEGLYVEFWMKFEPDWSHHPSGDASKIFRVGSWSGQGSEFQAFSGGEQGPLFLWGWLRDSYGVRNFHSLRGGPHGENYGMTSETRGSHQRESLNYTTDTVGHGVNGTTPKIPDRVNGGYISDNLSQIVDHPQIFGTGEWNKVAFYVQMNSSPGVPDGVLRQWLNDEQIVNVRDIIWVSPSTEDPGKMVQWNFFSIGGNDYFKSYPMESQHQEWFAIDDLRVADQVPEYLELGLSPPNPPGDVELY